MTNQQLCLPAPRIVEIPVGPISSESIRRLLGSRAKGKREFETHPTTLPCYLWQGKSYPYKGQWSTWAKYTNLAYITSYATLSEGMVTLHHAVYGIKTIKAPSGTRWEADQHGLKVVRRDGMEYHPTQEELWSNRCFATRIKQRLSENYKLRQIQKRQEKEQKRFAALIQRDLATTRVSIRDSMRAGNCVEGTLRFAETKLKLDRKEITSAGYLFHVGAKTLLRVSNGDKKAVERAIRAAWMRETTVSI